MELSDTEIEEEMPVGTPPEILEAAESAASTLLPEKSRTLYEKAYKSFMDWRRDNNIDSFSENVLLAYFKHLSERIKPTSLWTTYSMLKMTINIKNNVDIGKYTKLCAFLKRASDGYKPKKSKILTPEQIRDFLTSAPDEKYLFVKVGLIFGIMGALRREELMHIETCHVEDHKSALLVHIPNRKTKTERQFVIDGNFYKICKKYMELRPQNLHSVTRFFLNYQRGRCTKQPIGINKFGGLASQVAKFLKLPDPASYTGHCLRRSSANILIGSSLNFNNLNCPRWSSTSDAECHNDHFSSNTNIMEDDQEQVKTEDPSVSVKEEQIEDTSDLIKEEPAIEDSIEMQSFTDYNTDTDNEKEYILEGPRSVDINFFFRSLIQVSNHNYTLGCKLENVKIVGESRHSFSSIIHMRCNMCNMEFNISTTDSSLEVNHSSAVQFVKVEDRSEEFEQSTTLNTTCYQSFQS